MADGVGRMRGAVHGAQRAEWRERTLGREHHEVSHAGAETTHEARRVAEPLNLQHDLVDLPEQRSLVVGDHALLKFVGHLEHVAQLHLREMRVAS